MNWNEQSIVITGAYGGLGQKLCSELSELGAQLILTGRDSEKLRNLCASLKSAATFIAGDVTEESFQEQLLETLANIKSKGHILINNAAVSDARFLNHQSADRIRQMLDVNLLAPILLSQKLQSWLSQAETGKVINIGSTFGNIGFPGFSSYCASKFGLRGFSQALNREWQDTNVSVHYLAPRAIATSINSSAVNQLNDRLGNKVDTPEKIVPQIIAAIERGKKETFFGWPEKLFVKINNISPSLVAGSIKGQHKIIKHYLNS